LLGHTRFLIPGRLRAIYSSKSKYELKEDARLERGLWALTDVEENREKMQSADRHLLPV